MPTDYKSRSSGREKRPLPGFVWFLAGLVLGLFATLIVYLDKQPDDSTSFGAAVQQELNKLRNTSDSNEKKPAEKKPEEKKSKEPRFNFYTILPELEVLIPDAETTMPGKRSNPPSTGSGSVTTSNKQYILQAGSFRNRSDADKLKARLALLGFEASIQSVTVNREDWYRVRVGPYRNTAEMYRSLNLLHGHDVDAMAMELK